MRSHSVSASIMLLVLVTASGYEPDRVKDLPGQPPVNFEHYAGYIDLKSRDEKSLFYWFFEAEHDPRNKPLVLWLHGGPGCSSVAFGSAQELGPFLIQTAGIQLTKNNYSWNKVASMLFLESPVGVGFSYANNTNIYNNLGDKSTAADTYEFLIQWFNKFTAYKSHPFYITGESYAGHYAPQLADLIYEGNKAASKEYFIHLKGLMVGNAVLNDPTDTAGIVEYAWTHGIISDKLHSGIIKECDFSSDNVTHSCSMYLSKFFDAYAYIDPYGIYSPVCLTTNEKTRHPKIAIGPSLIRMRQHEVLHKLGFDPCGDAYPQEYLNRRDVQKALHANITNLPYPYMACGVRNWTDTTESVLPILSKLLNAGLRIWVYSGDTDGRVPVTSTRMSINKMGLKTNEEWRPWFHDRRVAGWVETYSGGLTLATVHGAGHQVPRYAPAQSLTLFSHFLSAQSLPYD